MWVAISIFTDLLFVQPLRKEKERRKWYDGKHKPEGIWRELCFPSVLPIGGLPGTELGKDSCSCELYNVKHL